MSLYDELLEAVSDLRKAEKDVIDNRIIVANLLKEAAKRVPILELHKMTQINRTTIYWLINAWSTPSENSSRRN